VSTEKSEKSTKIDSISVFLSILLLSRRDWKLFLAARLCSSRKKKRVHYLPSSNHFARHRILVPLQPLWPVRLFTTLIFVAVSALPPSSSKCTLFWFSGFVVDAAPNAWAHMITFWFFYRFGVDSQTVFATPAFFLLIASGLPPFYLALLQSWSALQVSDTCRPGCCFCWHFSTSCCYFFM